MSSTHDPVPVHAPLQPVNLEPGSGVAVRVTEAPLANGAVQTLLAEPHWIQAGLLVTHAFRLTTSGARKPPLDGLIVNAPLIGPELSPPVLNVRSVLQLAPEPRLLPHVLLPRLKPPVGVSVRPSDAAWWLVSVTV